MDAPARSFTPGMESVRRGVARAMMDNPKASSALGHDVLGVVSGHEPGRVIMALMAATQVAIEELARRLEGGAPEISRSEAQCAIASIVAENFTAFAWKDRH